MTLDDVFDLVRERNLEFHGLYEERSPRHSPDQHGSAPWNCRLVYRYTGVDGKTIFPMYCHGQGNSAYEAIGSAIHEAERVREIQARPLPNKSAMQKTAQNFSLEDLEL
jgi:hypothetical protein